MSPERNQDQAAAFGRLKRNLMFTREFDIKSSFDLFSIVHGDEITIAVDKQGFSLTKMRAFQQQSNYSDEAYAYVQGVMFDIAKEYKIDLEQMGFGEDPEATLPVQMLFAALVVMENPTSLPSREAINLTGEYLGNLAQSYEQRELGLNT